MDPVSLALMLGGGLLQMFNKQPSQQFKQSYSNNPQTDPIHLLQQALGAVNNAQTGMLNMGLYGTPRSYVQPTTPTSVPGIPFAFGGGQGVDPAYTNKSLLNPIDISPLIDAFQQINRPGGSTYGGTQSTGRARF